MKRYHLQHAGDGQPFTLVSGCPGPSGLCTGVSPAAVNEGCALAVVLGLLAAVAPRGERGLWGCGLRSLGLTAVCRPQLLLSTCRLPRSGIKPTSPALAGGFLPTEPPVGPQRVPGCTPRTSTSPPVGWDEGTACAHGCQQGTRPSGTGRQQPSQGMCTRVLGRPWELGVDSPCLVPPATYSTLHLCRSHGKVSMALPSCTRKWVGRMLEPPARPACLRAEPPGFPQPAHDREVAQGLEDL